MANVGSGRGAAMAAGTKSAGPIDRGMKLHRGKYAPESFIVPGQDQNGNSIRLWCRVVPLLDRAIDTIFSSKKFPFRTKGDLMRWCVKTGVERLEEMEPVPGSVLVQVDAMMKVLADEQDCHAFITLFDTMGKTVGMHVQAQAIGEARRVVAQMMGFVNKMGNEYWKRRYTREMKEKFGYLLDGKTVAGAGLGSHEDHGPDTTDDEMLDDD